MYHCTSFPHKFNLAAFDKYGSGFGMLSRPQIMHILLPTVFIGGSNHVLHVTTFTTLD
ncbi:hypothetical protein BDA96_04G270700 [Sorghum bicolor]|uniref:Uncharacterized protein n=1 Tax=Sorghum bicolor TaxID=4558 RepID=A0A921R678_SORBI|nr:hypothetical protein BDA96_04G270700 [Sorghum bicolor]